MEDLYLEHILEHYRYPRNKVEFGGEDKVCTLQNHGCGDELRVQVKTDAMGFITSIVWDGAGCAISQASASIFSDRFVGQSSQELIAWDKDAVERELGVSLSPAREKCALLFVRAVQRFLEL